MAGGIRRRCRCRDENGRDLGAKCPKLTQRSHGTYQVRQEMAPTQDGQRQVFRRYGYEKREDAQADLDRVRELLNLAEGDVEDGLAITEMLLALEHGENLPETEVVKQRLRSNQALNDKGTMGDWLDIWHGQQNSRVKKSTLRKATRVSYESHIRLYLKPKLGNIRRDRFVYEDVVEAFNKIDDDNDAIAAANTDRRAMLAEIKATRGKDQRRLLREQLATMEPFRRTVGLNSQGRILATLRKCVNDGIVQKKFAHNPATHYSVGATRPKPLIWTAKRVEKWRETGCRPGPVMVWTPAQAGMFLDCVEVEDTEYEAMWHLLVFRGPRRGETAGLHWTETHLDESAIEITTQLTEVEYAIEEGDPKSEAGARTIPIDAEGVRLLTIHQARQNERKRALGSAWVESGKVFTLQDGSQLRPSWIGKRFEMFYTAAGLPPIRLHDLRHTAATLMLAAGIDMKVVQETLGHSTLATTSDIYTSVLPELAHAAAEAVTTIVPRRPPTREPRAPKPEAGAPATKIGAPKIVGPALSNTLGLPSGSPRRSTRVDSSEGVA